MWLLDANCCGRGSGAPGRLARSTIVSAVVVEFSKWVGKHNGDGTYDINAP